MANVNDILQRDWSKDFINIMQNRIIVSHYKYGANFAMIEYMHPSHPQAHFRATGSDESPGLKNGISYKELMEEGENG